MITKWFFIELVMLLCVAQVSLGNIDPDLVGWWKLDETSGNIAADSSGHGNDGTVHGSPKSIVGVIDRALKFHGQDEYIEVSDKGVWTFSGDFTITLWIKFDTFNPNWWEAAFIGHDEGTGAAKKWIFSYDQAENKTVFHINGPAVGGHILTGNPWTAQIGVWHFVGISRSGDTYTFYNQGVADGAEINSAVIPNVAAPLTIGWAEGTNKLDGAMDDVRIYNRALSEAEIARLALIGTNDDCEFAEPIDEVTQLPFDTRQASFDGPGYCMTSPNIWYCYTASCTGQATVSLCGSSYDTMLAIYKGCECLPTLSKLIGCNDDFCWLQSQITFNVVAGNSYLIEVGGYRSPAGGGGQGEGEDPVSHWKLNEGQGQTAYDSEGDNDGTIYGAVWTTGKYGNALDFDGTDDYVDCGNDSSLSATTGLTMAGWVRFDASKWNTLLMKDGAYGVRIHPTYIYTSLWNDSGSSSFSSSFTYQTDTWYHIAVAWGSGSQSVRVYVDGDLIDDNGTFSGPLRTSSRQDLLIGKTSWSDSHTTDGKIDEVMVFDQALSEQRIEQLYEQELYEQELYEQGCTGEGVLTITCEGLVAVEHDLGDAPDSSNNISTAMNAYSTGKYQITANFPTTSLSNSGPKGPVHLQPLAVAHLGEDVTFENEADKGPDEDWLNNIDPANNAADMDGADDGVVFPVQMPHCGWATLDYFVNVTNPGTNLWVNIWCDWNRDGDWDDDSSTNPDMNCGGQNVSEWAVQNQYLFGLQQGLNYITTPAFLSWHPEDGPEDIWMRITLSEQPWKGGQEPGRKGSGGSGPAEGYEFGETEDYLFVPNTASSICQDFNGDGNVDFNDLYAMLLKWLESCP